METLDTNMKNLLEKLDNKQALHAERLGFEHPLSKENHLFQSDPPKEMLAVSYTHLRAHSPRDQRGSRMPSSA